MNNPQYRVELEAPDDDEDDQGRKLMSCSQSQELSQIVEPAPDWLFNLVRPIRGQSGSLTHF